MKLLRGKKKTTAFHKDSAHPPLCVEKPSGPPFLRERIICPLNLQRKEGGRL